MGREAMIRADMESVGTYSEIFEPSIRQLAKQERELSRAEKAWRQAGGQMVAELVNKTGCKYTAKDPHYAVVDQLRKDIQSLRNQLGLTPTGLKRAKAQTDAFRGAQKSAIEEMLEAAHDAALENASLYMQVVDGYVDSVLSGEDLACPEIIQACQRYRRDLQNPKWEFKTEPANEIIAIIETTLCHQQGEFLDATPLRGTPFYLLPYHKFIIFNIMGFYIAGTKERRFKEAFDFVPRKNVKTTFAAALAWALALYERRSGSKVYEVGGALKQALEGFNFLVYNLRRQKLTTDSDPVSGFCVINNNMERSITGDMGEDGFISINALAANPDKQDSFNCNIVIADEMHTYKSAKQYQILKDATKAYTNSLVIGISSGGELATGFCAKRVEYCRKILNGTVNDEAAESIFVFMAIAPKDENGEVDYTNPDIIRMANPGWGHSIRPQKIINDAMQAKADPQLRPEFLQKSLNVFIAALRAWFNIDEFRASDSKYNWTLKELAKLPVKWYGGSDLSKLHDLTAAALFGRYKGVDIIIPHCWFPLAAAAVKADEDNIPLFGWQEDGWLDMSNDKVTNHADVVKWYENKRKAGFKIRRVGHDRKFCREYFVAMKRAHFSIKDQPQLFTRKSEGFRYLEASAKAGTLYYLHAEPFEYCVQNVRGIEKAGIKGLHIPRQIHKTLYFDHPSRIKEFDMRCLYSFINTHTGGLSTRAERLGYEILGPIIYAYCEWIHRKLREWKSAKVWFAARDMYLFAKAYEELYGGDDNCDYIYISRKSLRPVLTLVTGDLTASGEVFARGKYSLKELVKYMGYRLENLILDGSVDIDSKKYDVRELGRYPEVRAALDSPSIRMKEEELGKSGITYLRQHGLFDHNVVLADVGWHGTTQYLLKRIQESAVSDHTIHGLYLGCLDGTDEKIGKDSYHSFFFKETDHCGFMTGTVLFECLILAPHGSTVRYQVDGGKSIPVLGKTEEIVPFILRVQSGAMQFVRDYRKSALREAVSPSPQNICRPFERLANVPKQEELISIGSIEFDNFYHYKMAEPKSWGHYILHPSQLKNDFKYAPWRIGFLYKLFKLRLPYGSIYSFLRGKQGRSS